MDMHGVLSSPLAVRVGWTLLHSLWQGAAVCAAAAVVLSMLRRSPANRRYAVACAAMLLMAGLPLLTYALLPAPPERPIVSQHAPAPAATPVKPTAPEAPRIVSPAPPPTPDATAVTPAPAPPGVVAGGPSQAAKAPSLLTREALEPFLPYAAALWLAGVSLLSAWRIGGWMALQRLRLRASLPMPVEVRDAMTRVTRRLGLARPVQVIATARIDVPMVVGFLKPAILFPPALAAGLSVQQVEAILAHELAHVRRHDYLALLLQTLIETLLFYHPGTWWLSRRVSLEREQCCDDIAAAATGDRREYAGALVAIEEFRHALPALAATGTGARELMLRIGRLVGVDIPTRPRRGRAAGMALLAVLALAVSMTLVARGQAQAAGTITIHVQELESGHPVADATVRVRGEGLNVEDRTDESGNVQVAVGTAKREGLSIEVGGQGFTTARTGWTPTAEQGALPARFNIILEKTHAIGGKVVDQEGKPLPGAKVIVAARKKYANSPQTIRSFDTVTADAQGRWEYAKLPGQVDEVEVAASHELCLGKYGFFVMNPYEDVAALRNKTATLTLTRGTPVVITVKNPAGAPEADARIEYGDSRAGSNMIPPFRVKDDGTLTLGIAPGQAVITVKAAGYAPELQRITVGKDPLHVTIDLKPAQSIAGRILDRDGKPVGGGYLFFDTWRDARTLLHRQPVDTNGRWRWEGGPADEMFVDVLIPNFATLRGVRVKAGEENVITLKRQTTFRGTVIDAATGEPVKGYQLKDGIAWGDGRPVSWGGAGPLRSKAGEKPGQFEVTFDQTQYPAMILRVEALGYLPADSPSILLNGTATEFTFKLAKGVPVEGALLGLEGKPLANTTVYLSEASRQLQIDLTRRLDARDASLATTDAQGRFQFTPQKDVYRLFVVGNQGFVFTTREAFEKNQTLTLQPWARITGEVRRGKSPLPNATVRASTVLQSATASRANFATSHAESLANASGKFVIERVFPGEVDLSWDEKGGTLGYSRRVSVKAGETLAVTLGGTGRAVTGKAGDLPADLAAARDNLSISLMSLHQHRTWVPPVEVMEMPAAEAQAWMEKFRQTDEGRKVQSETDTIGTVASRYFRTAPDPDGSFRFDDIPAGRYWLRLEWSKGKTGQDQHVTVADVSRDLVVAAPQTGSTDDALDTGTLAPLPSRKLAPGDPVPPLTALTLDEKEVSLSDYRGKYLVVVPWATFGREYLPSPEVNTLWSAYKNHPRFALLGISTEFARALKYTEARKIEWPTLASYRAWSLVGRIDFKPEKPLTIIDPEGKVHATGLTPAEAKAALDKLLAGP